MLHRADAADFERLVCEWLKTQAPAGLEQLAVDGKVLESSRRADGKSLKLLSAVTHRLRLTLGGGCPLTRRARITPRWTRRAGKRALADWNEGVRCRGR